MLPKDRSAHALARRRLRQIAPFTAAALFAFSLVRLPPEVDRPELVALGAVLTALLVVAAVFLPWHRLPLQAQLGPALGFLPVVALLRHSEGGGSSTYTVLSLLPVIWLALYSTRGGVMVGMVGLSATIVLPILVIGAPEYPSTEWRRAGVYVAVAAVAGFTVRSLIERIRTLSDRLAALARTDALTELPNRRVWDEQLADELARAGRGGYPISVAVIDINNLKAVNDRLGHAAGDALLQEAARSWQRQARGTDLLARIGGDEFALLLPGCSAATARRVADRVLESNREAEACAGVAEWDGVEDGRSLVARADADLYRHKALRAKKPDRAGHLTVV